MEVGTGGDLATQSPSSVAMVLADPPPKASAKSSTSCDTTVAAAQVAQERNGAAAEGGLCVARKGDANDTAPLPETGGLAAADPAAAPPKTPQTPASSVQYVGDNADHENNGAEKEEDDDGESSSSSLEDDGDEEEEYERTPTNSSSGNNNYLALPPDTTDTYQESPVKFRPVVVLEKESQRSPRKKLMAPAADASATEECVEGGKAWPAGADGLESIGLPTIDEAVGPSSSANAGKTSGTRPPLSGSSAGKNNRSRSRRSTAGGSNSSSSRGGTERSSTTNTTGGDILSAILDRTLTFMGCASSSNAFACGRTTGTRKRAASCRCGGADDQVWDGDVDDTATVNSVHVPQSSPSPSPRASPKQSMSDLNGRVQIQMRTSASGAVGDSTVAHQAARAAAAAAVDSGDDKAPHKSNNGKGIHGLGCTGTGGKYVASSPLTTTVPFDANDLSTIVPAASDAHHLPNTTNTKAAGGGDGGDASPKGGAEDDDDDDEALLSPTHFFRPVSFDIDESSLAGSIAGSLASAIRGVR